MRKAFLALSDGTVFEGYSYGVTGEVIGEVVFNTSVAGYQELITDPSYSGQLVVMTYPQIGNYGFISDVDESDKAFVKGFIVKEIAENPNNFRCEGTLDAYLKRNNVIAIAGIDTRALTRILRDKGSMNGIITTDEHFDFERKKAEIVAFTTKNAVNEATTAQKYTVGTGDMKIAMLDLGVKRSLVNALADKGCTVTVYPGGASKEEILSENPNAVMVSSGPGNPADCTVQIETVKSIVGEKPMFGFGLGHQMIALALGGTVEKLLHGHRGNQPIKSSDNGKIYTSSQNHSYVVTAQSAEKIGAKVTYKNINDGTVEGLLYADKHIMSVQFYPEADCGFLFDEFLAKLEVK